MPDDSKLAAEDLPPLVLLLLALDDCPLGEAVDVFDLPLSSVVAPPPPNELARAAEKSMSFLPEAAAAEPC